MQRILTVIVIAGLLFTPAALAEMAVVSVSPTPRTTVASTAATIEVVFDRPVDRTTVVPLQSFWAFGRWSGTVQGTISYADADARVILTPSQPFSAGENVMVVLSHDLAGTDGMALRDGGYSFQFWTASASSPSVFRQVQQMSTLTTPGSPTQAYGGLAADLDNDGYLDLTIVNEITADLRIFLNRADGSGTFDPFLVPTTPVGNRASPSESSDFNRDGNVDICVANIDDDSVSILLGNGDGTFAPQQLVSVGAAPRGIAVLDVDGDGDTDVVNTNSTSSNLSLLINDGTGTFSAPTFFDGGGSAEWALAAADMNHDGLLDLIVGARNSQEVLIHAGNGDGTFTQVSSQASAGRVWMLVCGDVNGDGAEDVSVVNSTTNNGAILMGDGAGNLGLPAAYSTDPFSLATDLGDVDGDGDLDWITSSFDTGGPGQWTLLKNNGSGSFAVDEEFPAPSAGSCALMLDADNDGDLDLALIDEIDDEVFIYENGGILPVPAGGGITVAMLVMLVVIAVTIILRRSAAA